MCWGRRRRLGCTPPTAGTEAVPAAVLPAAIVPASIVPAAILPRARPVTASGRAGVSRWAGLWPRPRGTPVRRLAPVGRVRRPGTSRLPRAWRLPGRGVRKIGAGGLTVPWLVSRPGWRLRGPVLARVCGPYRGAAWRSRPGVRRAAVITRIAHAASVLVLRGEAGLDRYFGRCGRCLLITLTGLVQAGILHGRPRASACPDASDSPHPVSPPSRLPRVRRSRIGSHHTKAYHRAHIQPQGRRHPASVARH